MAMFPLCRWCGRYDYPYAEWGAYEGQQICTACASRPAAEGPEIQTDCASRDHHDAPVVEWKLTESDRRLLRSLRIAAE